MARYTLNRKTFSENNGEKKGLSTGAKIAAGVGTVAGGLLAAKHGMLGGTAQRGVGKGMMSLGMKKSGAKTLAQGQWKGLGEEAQKGLNKENWITNRASRNERAFDLKKQRAEARKATPATPSTPATPEPKA